MPFSMSLLSSHQYLLIILLFEKEREGERQREGKRYIQTERDRQTNGQGIDGWAERQRQRQRGTHREIDRQTVRDREGLNHLVSSVTQFGERHYFECF